MTFASEAARRCLIDTAAEFSHSLGRDEPVRVIPRGRLD
jgi:hypothetical protein